METKKRSPWAWVPSLYFAEGIPYIIVMTLSVVMYKRLGVSNADIALYTSWLYLPWVIKPLWSPLVDLLKTKRWWIVSMQLAIGAGLAGVAFTIPVPSFFQYTLAFFWLLAFSSATHDIAADGFYLLGLNTGDQAYYVGIRSTFYRMAMLTGQGLLVILAGYVEDHTGLQPIRLQVAAVHAPAHNSWVDTTVFAPLHQSQEMHFVLPEKAEIPIAALPAHQADSLRLLVDEWNTKHGFCPAEQTKNAAQQSPGPWSQYIAQPLAAWLKLHFGTAPVAYSATRGNVAIVPIQLSRAPEAGQNVVLNLSHLEGDVSIQLAKTYRYTFHEHNYRYPALALVQLDAKLREPSQAAFIGRSGNIVFAWSTVFFAIAVLFSLFFLYHRRFLPRPAADAPSLDEGGSLLSEFLRTFVSFFRRKDIGISLAFLLLYRLSESQIVKMATPFLIDARELGGMGITTGQLGLVYGTFGLVFLTLGGILGGVLASRNGLKYWLWWMALAINLPNGMYLLLALFKPTSLWAIGAAVSVEQFGYGFGFTAYMLYMMYISQGKHQTAHFAITTGFMALGMMLPGMVSGWLQELIGYQNFFVWVLICTLPPLSLLYFVKIDPQFGRKKSEIDNS